ncbi:MAG: PD-(D/E)XK nuclease family protein [Candidatus Omnitrophica bacterium]|nr:PD-(D/E)XK nuclease family protein [Candidatus Omnitrophota bacterium]
MIENLFSWSKSTDEKFQDCPRKFYYDKYLSWGGWETSSPRRTRAAYVLKNLKNRWAWKGERTHHIIEQVLKSMRRGQPIPPETALSNLTQMMREDYRSSRERKNWQDPKNNVGLFEHEYKKNIDDAVWKRVHDEAAACVRHFYGSDLFKELAAEDKSGWLMIEDLEEFQFDGAKIYVKLDFARKKDGVVEIIDWKTGKNGSDNSLQMGVYALFASEKWKLPLERVRASIFNLTSPFPVLAPEPLSVELIEKARGIMSKSIQSIRELLEDPVKNIPKPVEAFAFARRAEICDRCNFYRICEKYC